MRVLYVEDEKFLADAVKFNLEKQGISVDIAPDGEEGEEIEYFTSVRQAKIEINFFLDFCRTGV